MTFQKQIVIHCQPTLLETIKNKKYSWRFSEQFKEDEIDVIVNDIEELEDDEVCEHYGLNYNQVNCIEAHNFVC